MHNRKEFVGRSLFLTDMYKDELIGDMGKCNFSVSNKVPDVVIDNVEHHSSTTVFDGVVHRGGDTPIKLSVIHTPFNHYW